MTGQLRERRREQGEAFLFKRSQQKQVPIDHWSQAFSRESNDEVLTFMAHSLLTEKMTQNPFRPRRL